MKYNFDEVIDRRGTNAMTTDGYKSYIFHDPDITFPFPEEEFIRMWVADMDFAVAPEILDGIRGRLEQKILGYTELTDPMYYRVFSQWCQKRYDWKVDREQIVTSPGIVAALRDLVHLILNTGDKVLILTPSYRPFQAAAKDNGLEIICSDLLVDQDGYYTIDFEDFRKKASCPEIRLCIFCNPHNPSGRTWTEKELKQVSDILQKNDLWVISDEIHCDILRTGLTHIPLAKVMGDYKKIITCMSVSKTFNLAGMMFSNIIITDKKLRYRWKKTHNGLDNPLSVAAAQAAYERGENWLTQMKKYVDENFQVLDQFIKERLPKAVFCIPEATYLAWIDISAYVDGKEFLPLLFARKGKILLEGGDMFVQNAEGKIRLNLACPRSVLMEGLQRIEKVLIN